MEHRHSFHDGSQSVHLIPRKPLGHASVSSFGNPDRGADIQSDHAELRCSDCRSKSKGINGRRQKCGLLSSRLNRLWLPEIAGLLISFLALLATVLLLASREHKPLPEWPSFLSVNSLVAIFTSIMKAAMIYSVAEGINELKWIWYAKPRAISDFDRFDSAGRGPWGALLLLCSRPSNLLASLGALITILALAIDPFSQQVLQFVNCGHVEYSSETFATVVRTNNFTRDQAVGISSSGTRLDNDIVASIYQGLLSPPSNVSGANLASCTSGNCSFPQVNGVAYTTLGFCSSVIDVTSSVKDESGEVRVTPEFDIFNDEERNYTFWKYTLPSGLKVSGGRINESVALASDDYRGNMSTDGGNFTLQRRDFGDDSVYTFEVLMAGSKCFENDSYSFMDNCTYTPFAILASLIPCIYMYGNASVKLSKFEELVVNTTMLVPEPVEFPPYWSLAGNYPSLPEMDCSPSDVLQGNKTQPTSRRQSGGRYNLPSDMSPDEISGLHLFATTELQTDEYSDIKWFDPGCTYYFGSMPNQEISDFLSSTIFGSGFDIFEGDQKPRLVQFDDSRFLDAAGDPWLKRLWNGGHADMSSATAFMDGLAVAMTNAIRLGGDPSNSKPARGSVELAQTCVAINWAWIALPAVLVLLSAIFLAATIALAAAHTKRSGGDQVGRLPWKSSSMPLLFCGLKKATKARLDGLDGLNGFDDVQRMKECGDEVKVQLVRADKEGYGGYGYDPFRADGGAGLEAYERSRWVLSEQEGVSVLKQRKSVLRS